MKRIEEPMAGSEAGALLPQLNDSVIRAGSSSVLRGRVRDREQIANWQHDKLAAPASPHGSGGAPSFS